MRKLWSLIYALWLAILWGPMSMGQTAIFPPPVATASQPGGVLNRVCASGYFQNGSYSATGAPNCLAGSTGTAPTQRGVDAIKDEGFVADGTTDNGPKLQAWLNGLTSTGSHELFVPCTTGTSHYMFATAVTTSANNITIIGEGTSSISGSNCVVFDQGANVGPMIWFNGAGVSQQQGMRIENITFMGYGGSSGVGTTGQIGLRISDYEYLNLGHLSFVNYSGTVYSAGTVSVTNGSTAVTGTGTAWTAAMNPGELWIAGLPQQICGWTSATAITLCETYQGATNATAAYSLDTGIGMLMDGGAYGCSGCFTQYGQVDYIDGIYNRYAVMMKGDGTNAEGVSRVQFVGGNLQCNRLADSAALVAGGFTDTITWPVTDNNCAVGVIQEETGEMKTNGAYFENDGTPPVVTTCNGGVALKACTMGMYLSGSAFSHTYGNQAVSTGGNGIGTLFVLGPNADHTQIIAPNVNDQGSGALIAGSPTGAALSGYALTTTFTSGNMADNDRRGSIALSSGTATHTFATGIDNFPFPVAPTCMAQDVTTPADLAYAVITGSSTTSWTMTLNGTGTDTVKWICNP